jgi:hypothetical protein
MRTKTTPTYDRPGPTYTFQGIDFIGVERRYYWRRSLWRVALLLLAAAGVFGLVAWGCCS